MSGQQASVDKTDFSIKKPLVPSISLPIKLMRFYFFTGSLSNSPSDAGPAGSQEDVFVPTSSTQHSQAAETLNQVSGISSSSCKPAANQKPKKAHLVKMATLANDACSTSKRF